MSERPSTTTTPPSDSEKAANYWFEQSCAEHNMNIKMRDILEKCEDALLYPRDEEKRQLALKELEEWFTD